MHDYLRAVGFSKVQHKRDLQRLLDMVMGSPDSEFASDCGGTVYAEKCRDFVSNAGITVRGEVDEHGMFSYEYYFPHYTGHQISLTDDVSVEKISEREEYDGMCDVVNLGVSLIFHMNQYARLLRPDGWINLKTDSKHLYAYTGEVIRHYGLTCEVSEPDIYGSGFADEVLSVKTAYETRFLEMGLPITYTRFALDGRHEFPWFDWEEDDKEEKDNEAERQLR